MESRLVALAAPALLLAAALALPFFVSNYYLQFASKIMLMGIAAMALNLAVGFGGLVSMCHAAFFGLSGYVLAIYGGGYEGASLYTSLPLAIAITALAAALIGALSLRTRGIYFIMVTLAFGEMLFYLFHDTKIGGGSDGAYIYVKPLTNIGTFVPFDLEKSGTFYIVVVLLTFLSWLLLRTLTQSHFGHALMATRDNERRARSIGFNLFKVRWIAFIISGAIAGAAGYFNAAQFGFVAPQLLGWHLSAMLLVMVVLGGMKSVAGPLLGAAALLILEEVLKIALPDTWKLAEGIIIILLVLMLPDGLRQLVTLASARRA